MSEEQHTNAGFEGDSTKKPDLSLSRSQTLSEKSVLQSSLSMESRGQWGNKCDFFLSALGYAVGLGNVWRFPYLAYIHGGGSFLVPYTLMLLCTGLPLFFMELALGQFSGAGPTRLFGRLAPALKGLGFAMIAVTVYVAVYYNVIIAWTIFYVFASMNKELPWEHCHPEHSTPSCFEPNQTTPGTSTSPCSLEPCLTPPEDYFNSVVLGYHPTTTSFSNLGQMQWHLVLCLFGAWLIVCLALIKGVQSSGKVVYFTALFPFFVLFVLFIKTITLEGAMEGIAFYVTPDFDKLLQLSVWSDAATQIFYSLGPAFGGLITLASYNKFDNNCHRDAILIAFCNCATSVFAGFVVFAILGFMAVTNDVAVSDVVKGGPGLAFVVYPDAVAKMSLANVWSLLFFLMLITLGLDSMFTLVETITTALMDHFKHLREHKELVVIATCLIGFLLGLSMCFSGGILIFTLVDNTCASFNILIFALLEVLVVAHLHGVDNFIEELEQMNIRLKGVTRIYWRTCWLYITPFILILLILGQLLRHAPVALGDYVFETWVQIVGWVISFSSIIFLPLLTLRQVLKRRRAGKELGLALFKPTSKWRPATFTSKDNDKL